METETLHCLGSFGLCDSFGSMKLLGYGLGVVKVSRAVLEGLSTAMVIAIALMGNGTIMGDDILAIVNSDNCVVQWAVGEVLDGVENDGQNNDGQNDDEQLVRDHVLFFLLFVLFLPSRRNQNRISGVFSLQYL